MAFEGHKAGRVVGGTVAVLLLAVLASGGCIRHPTAMWADTASPTGGFSNLHRQWAYDGEPVTFELECPVGTNYVVFGVDGNETVIEEAASVGRFRVTRTFKAGPKPVTYEVYATPFVTRDRRDWYYDDVDKSWYFHPGSNDKSDIAVASEKSIQIVCYRREVHVKMEARGGAPTAVDLTLTTATGEVTRVPRRRPGDSPETRGGFLLLGPDKKGVFEISYQPTYKEVGRSGETLVEVLVTHADGTLERVRQSLDTP